MTIAKRLYYLDNLRVALMMLVIAHHVGQAYGPTGGEWLIKEAARAEILGPFFTVNRSFFMSLFFMIAGYFTVMAVDAKGPRAFFRERLLRLGLPVVGWGLFTMVIQVLAFRGPAWPVDVGHLWFLEHLLIFSGVYALWRTLRPGQGENAPQLRLPRTWEILAFAFLVMLASAIIRTWFDIDVWVKIFGFVRVAFADAPRDLAFFIVGLLAYRGQWFSRFSKKAGMAWLAVGVILALAWYAYAMIWRYEPWVGDMAAGLIYPTWEALLCCGMCIGLSVLFRERLDFQTPLTKSMAQSQMAAYIFHLPIVLGVQALALGLPLPPLAKFVLVTAVSIPVTFAFSNWVRKPLRL